MAALSPAWRLALLVGAAFGLRLLSLWLTHGTPLAGDEREYFVLASRFAGGEPLSPMADRPPLVPALFGAVLAASGGSMDAVRIVNALLGALLVVPVHALGRTIGDDRTGFAAGALVAVYPPLLTASHGLWSEPLYLLLAGTGLAVLCASERGAGARANALAALAGLLFAGAALAREVGLFVPVLLAPWLVVRARAADRRPAAAALMLVTCLLAVAPWTAWVNGWADYGIDTRGFSRGAAPVALLSRTTWQNLYVGNAGPQKVVTRSGDEKLLSPRRHYYTLGQTRLQTEAAARLLALDAIRARLPAWPFEKLRDELPDLLAPTSFAQRRLLAERDGAHGEWAYRFRHAPLAERGARRFAAGTVAAFYVAAVVVGAAGLALVPNARWAALLALFVAAHVVPCLVAFGASRFRLPVMGVLLLGVAWMATNVEVVRAQPRWRLAAASALALGVAAIVAARLGMVLSPRWG